MRAVAWLVPFACAGLALQASELGSESERQRGGELYQKYCSQCHGVAGDGQGHATPRVLPRPRDFTSGKYKFRTTPSGMLPTDDDLRKVIREGLPYTSMPGWSSFTDAEVTSIIYYLKTFSADFKDPALEAPPISIPDPPASDQASIDRGLKVFEAQGCAACHGELGRGDGTSAPTLTDDWGDPIRAADMTMRWTFRGGPTRKDIFQTFSTGVNGTPMPSFADSLQEGDRWDLVNYIYSLGESDTPDYSKGLILVTPVADEIDLAAGTTLFATAPVARVPLVGQIMEPGRNFHPSVSSIQVQAVTNGKEIAFRLRWNDMRAETSGSNGPDLVVPLAEEDPAATGGAAPPAEGADDFWGQAAEAPEAPAPEEQAGGDFWGEAAEEGSGSDVWGEEEGGTAGGGEGFTDAVALQFPSQIPAGIRKPYFIFGDVASSVDLWFVDLAHGDRVRQFVGRGSDSLTPSETDEFEALSSYDRGEWTVTLKRSVRSTSTISFAQEQFVPVVFSVWDGHNRERGNKRALSVWFHVYVEPAAEVSVVGPMVRAALIALLLELAIVFYLRRRHARAPDALTVPPGRGVPERGLAR